jgi:uncharacterized glyoxalase superfamily protein PhnB
MILMKTKKFIRAGAHLPVKNLRDTLTFYKDMLGFYDEWTWQDKDGGIRRDEMRLLFGVNPGYVDKINNASSQFNLMWFVDNLDEVYAEFKDRGIEIASPLKEYPYELREFAFIDINGYYIRVAEGIE